MEKEREKKLNHRIALYQRSFLLQIQLLLLFFLTVHSLK